MDSPALTGIRARRAILTLTAVVCALSLALPVSAFAALPTRSAAEIQARYAQLKPAFSGSPFEALPSLIAPYSAGKLFDAELQDGVHAIDYVRYLAGLPDDLALDAHYTDLAQHGAVLLAVGQFAHSQPRPADMTAEFYDTALEGTKRSNIGFGYSRLWDFNLACVSDADSVNLATLGHRRWLLNPVMAKTGMGLANGYAATYIGDFSRATPVDYDTVKWPAEGDFPAEMMPSTAAWSITLNPSNYSWTAGRSGYRVQLTRERDGKNWVFTSDDTNTNGEFFAFDTSGYGVANCFIFRPSPSSVGSYQNGDVFHVKLSGGITSKASGKNANISYRTRLVSQASGSVIAVTTTQLSGPSRVRVKHWLRLTGRVSAVSRGKVTVVAQRYSRGRWRAAGSKSANISNGRFSCRFKPSKKGRWRFYARYDGTVGANASTASRSGYRSVRVR